MPPRYAASAREVKNPRTAPDGTPVEFLDPAEVGWQTAFLDAYGKTGRKYEAAAAAEVSVARVRAESERDHEFADAVEAARQRYADRVEKWLEDLARGASRGNVIAAIVLAKRHRPHDFVERHQVVTANVSAVGTIQDAEALLKTMLGDVTETTRTSIAAPKMALAGE